MSLDGELKKWRDATEQLEPSPKLMASLQAQITPPPAAAPPVGGSIAMKVITVVLITVSIGAAAWFFATQKPKEPLRSARDAGLGAAVFDREPLTDGELDGGLAACPPLQEPSAPAMALMPGPVTPRLQVVKEARALMTRRPLTCAAQIAPLEDLRAHGRLDAQEQLTIDARRAVLCGLGTTDFSGVWARPAMWEQEPQRPPRPPRPCDESQWCRVPRCDLTQETCQRELAAQSILACSVLEARQRLLDHECVRTLRRQSDGGTELTRLNTALSSFGPDAGTAWCLEPAALNEAKRLMDLKVPFGSPPVNRRK
ncbi:MAG: hypothetical protein JNM17_12895 [Archangium sp.]|nr:hypothetical protein [Archangium sp.]